MRFEQLGALKFNVTVLWELTQNSLIAGYRRFGGTFPSYVQGELPSKWWVRFLCSDRILLRVILVINQPNQKSCFIISLLYASTCFEHYVLFIRRSKFYYTASGIITPVGGRPVHRSSLNLRTGRPPTCAMIPDAV